MGDAQLGLWYDDHLFVTAHLCCVGFFFVCPASGFSCGGGGGAAGIFQLCVQSEEAGEGGLHTPSVPREYLRFFREGSFQACTEEIQLRGRPSFRPPGAVFCVYNVCPYLFVFFYALHAVTCVWCACLSYLKPYELQQYNGSVYDTRCVFFVRRKVVNSRPIFVSFGV